MRGNTCCSSSHSSSGSAHPCCGPIAEGHGDIAVATQQPPSPEAQSVDKRARVSANLHSGTQGHLSRKSRQSSPQLRHSPVTPSHSTPPDRLKPTKPPDPGSEPPPPLFRTTGSGTHDTAGSQVPTDKHTSPTVWDSRQAVHMRQDSAVPPTDLGGFRCDGTPPRPELNHGRVAKFLPKTWETRLVLFFDNVCDPQEGPSSPWGELQRSIIASSEVRHVKWLGTGRARGDASWRGKSSA